MSKKIVVATDFSESAGIATQIARDLARRAGDSIVLLHIQEPLPLGPYGRPLDLGALERSREEEARSLLRARADELRAQAVAVDERLERGQPAEVIAALAKEVAARAIVVGSHGRRTIARLLLGSVAQRTLVLADRPVLVARPGVEPGGFLAWAAHARALRVTFAVDRSPGTGAAAAWLRWLCELGPVDVRMVHVCDPALEAVRLGLRPGTGGAGDIEVALERDLRGFVGELPGAGQISFALRASAGRPGEIVAGEAAEVRADLLLVGTHQRTRVERIWLGSTAELALRAARVPVACIPALSRGALEDAGKPDEV